LNVTELMQNNTV